MDDVGRGVFLCDFSMAGEVEEACKHGSAPGEDVRRVDDRARAGRTVHVLPPRRNHLARPVEFVYPPDGPAVEDTPIRDVLPILENIDFVQYQLLLYGLALVGMMLVRPEGLFPNRRRQRELRAAAEAGVSDLPAPTSAVGDE